MLCECLAKLRLMCPKPTALETHEFLESLRLSAKKEQAALELDVLELEEEEQPKP